MTRRARRYVVLLRGVNVGGHGKLPMAQLRQICTSLGCTDVSTYIQSGNVVLTSELTAEQLMEGLGSAIDDAVGFAPKVVVRTPSELADALAANPYHGTEPRFVHIGFLSSKPTAAALAQLGDVDCSPEGYRIIGRDVYLDFVNGAGQSKKLARVPFERKLGVAMTARNLKTVEKLVSLSSEPGG
jgi:uncharacterized protein (DUF1697 family)